MTLFKFKDLEFIDQKENIKVLFYRHFHFIMDKSDLKKIGDFKVNKHEIEFDATEKKASKFYDFIDHGLNNLINNITSKKTRYIHKNSGTPLIGNGSFGIVDRGSNLIEIKPVTGCNLDCIYCSVDENKRNNDFVVEKDYLVDELKKIIQIKTKPVEVHIGCQGEPLLYAPLIELVQDISKIKGVKEISMDTNGMLLNNEIIDRLINAGMTRFNLSVNAIDQKLAQKIANGGYSVNHAKNIAKYISASKAKLTIAPVFMQKINEDEIEDIIKFAKEVNADTIGIQNFLRYKFGKNPAKELKMEKFYDMLKALEKKHNVKLILSASDFGIVEDKTYDKPYKKGDIVEAEIICDGRLPDEKIAVTDKRTISVFGCNKRGRIKVKIIKNKHNIYVGTCV